MFLRMMAPGKTDRMQLFQYGKAEIDHLRSRDKKLGRTIDRIGMIERQIIASLEISPQTLIIQVYTTR